MNPSLIAFLSALACSVMVAPIVGVIARRFGIVDHPDGHRKLHRRIVPLRRADRPFCYRSLPDWQRYCGCTQRCCGPRANVFNLLMLLGLAGSLIVLLGILDDKIGLQEFPEAWTVYRSRDHDPFRDCHSAHSAVWLPNRVPAISRRL